MKLFKRKNKFTVGQLVNVWVYSETRERTILAEITAIEGDYCAVRFIDKTRQSFLLQIDETFCFPPAAHFRDVCHLAYDTMEEAIKMQKELSRES